MDLSTYTAPQLRQLSEQIDIELKKHQEAAVAKAREAIEAVAKGVGMSVAALMNMTAPAKAARPPLPRRYVNPEDPTQTWSGVGKRPFWVRRHTDAGGLLEALLNPENK